MEHQYRLVFAVQVLECLGESVQDFEVLGRALKADLQMTQRPAVLAGVEVDIDDATLKLGRLVAKENNALGDLNKFVAAAFLIQALGGEFKVLQGALIIAIFGVTLGELDAHAD